MIDKARTSVPLNSPMSKSRNPSWRETQRHQSQYKAPEGGWQPANAIFRRYANGVLDYPYACSKIFEAIDRVKDGGVLNEFEKATLSLLVPGIENLGGPTNAMAMTKVRLAPEELAKLRLLVMKKQMDIRHWRSGI
jgi:hypothetical protein